MSAIDSRQRYPQDLVAIFHAAFHPTQGNVIDWSLKASDDLSLDNLEFNALPSGLHLVEQDVVYFTKDGQHGVCVFRRRQTNEHGHRGYRLTSVGILLAKSSRPKPWRHIAALKALVTQIYSSLEMSGVLQPTESDWEPARAFFEDRKVRRADLSGAGDWLGWSHELDQNDSDQSHLNPTLHLSHLLRIIGPSSLTLYKHVIARKRILIYTLPPVEAACILCQVAADMCYEDQVDSASSASVNGGTPGRLRGKSREGINILGMITLMDMDRLHSEGQTGRGWIACTTDAIFLEKPSCYDLLIDLTTSTPNKATRPTFYASRPIEPQPSTSSRSGPTHRLSSLRFAWSDIKLWNELHRLLQLDSSNSCCTPHPLSSSEVPDASLKNSKFITAWTDVWKVYEDVCVVCAGLWLGSWRGNSAASYSTVNGADNWGSVRLEGDDDLTMTGMNSGRSGHATPSGSGSAGNVRSLGLGIEGRPVGSISRAMRRSSGMSWSSGKATVVNASASSSSGVLGGKRRQESSMGDGDGAVEGMEEEDEDDAGKRRDAQLLTTLALLQTFHAHTLFQLSTLESFIRVPSRSNPPQSTVYLSPRDVTSFELGSLSGADAKYVEWLADEYGGGIKVVVRRGWKDLLGVILGYG